MRALGIGAVLVSATTAFAAEPFLDGKVPTATLERKLTRRTKVVRAGSRYERLEDAAVQRHGAAVLLPSIVLDESSPDRVRVLCDEGSYRVAVWIDRDDLANVAREASVLVARPPLPARIERGTVGIHVPAGTIVRDLAVLDGGVVRVKMKGLAYEGAGIVDGARIGVTYAPSIAGPVEPRHGEVTADIVVYDAPDGVPLARLLPVASFGHRLYVGKLEVRPDGWGKLAYDDGSARIVGWVRPGDVTWLDKEPLYGIAGGGGSGRGGSADGIRVPAGARLIGLSSRDPIGVVLAPSTFAGSTIGAGPAQVTVRACGGTIQAVVDESPRK